MSLKDDMLSLHETGELLGVSGATVKTWSKKGIFPQPYAPCGRIVGWHKDVVTNWFKEQAGLKAIKKKKKHL